MTKKIKAAVLVSDGRMEVIAGELEHDGHEILICRTREDLLEMKRRAWEWDMLLLPIRGIDGEGNIAIPGQIFPVGEMLEQLKDTALVITGLQTPYLRSLQRDVLCYFDDQQVREQNARLTAEGVLYLLLKETTKSIFQQSVDLVGYGCVGKAVFELLIKLGISPRVVDKETGIHNGTAILGLEEWKNTTPSQVIINSVPALVADEKTAGNWPADTVFLDVASGAVGAEETVKKSIHYVAAPPLPGLVAEESAGRILAEYVKRQIALL